MKNQLLAFVLSLALLWTAAGCSTFRPTELQPLRAKTQTGTNIPRDLEGREARPKSRASKPKRSKAKRQRAKAPRPQRAAEEDVLTRGGFR